MTTQTPETLAAAHMDACHTCRALRDEARAERHAEIVADIERTRARALSPLPKAAWPLGRPWAPARNKGTHE